MFSKIKNYFFPKTRSNYKLGGFDWFTCEELVEIIKFNEAYGNKFPVDLIEGDHEILLWISFKCRYCTQINEFLKNYYFVKEYKKIVIKKL